VNQIIAAVARIMIKIDRMAPEGSMGSLTAIRANITIGVKSGNKETQKALAVSGFLATVNMIK
jgi:hypothetical protein